MSTSLFVKFPNLIFEKITSPYKIPTHYHVVELQQWYNYKL